MTRIVARPEAGWTVSLSGWGRALVSIGWLGLSLCAASAQDAKPDGKVISEGAKAGCDAACARQAIPAAVQACVPGIERQAPSDFEWMNRPTGSIFQEAEPPAGADTVVKFRGDSVRFLSPQGQWVRVTYECDYDTASRSVRSVKVRLGRIDGKGASAGAGALPSGSAGAGRGQAVTPAQQAQVKRPKPSEPSEVEIRQVAPSASR
jgi:hypothetical protein